ncbi:MAG: urea amidolyase family protein [Trueperaceae bacterium]|nr:urea amidolyase family protein [Trueperaceae bacterium]
MKLRRAGPFASVLDLAADPSPETSRRVAALRERLAATAPPEVRDLIPGFATILVEHRPTLTLRSLHAWARRATSADVAPPIPRRRHVRVAYGADADVAELETALGRPFAEIVRLHEAHEATVAFLGFTPGFPYLLGLPETLRIPRRETPRSRIPRGAVAIAAGMGGIYPAASPGGWWVLGRTDARLFDPGRDPPAWLAAGDRVTFEAVAPEELDAAVLAENGDAATPPVLSLGEPAAEVVEAVPGSASLQGAPRHDVGHIGAAHAGAIDRPALEAANRMVGNPPDTLALEALGQALTLRVEQDRLAAVAGGGTLVLLNGTPVRTWSTFRWPAGATLELLPDPAVRGRTVLLAVEGGFVGERWLGSDSTDVRAGAGGSKRWLAAGDRIGLGTAIARPLLAHPGRPLPPPRVLLRLHPGPQYDAEAFDALVTTGFRLADVDRTGARLDGRPVRAPTPSIASDGSPLGAVQIPPDGKPIVLLADRGRTGGYAKPAVADPRDLWRLAQARTGDEVWLLDARRDDAAEEPLDFGA